MLKHCNCLIYLLSLVSFHSILYLSLTSSLLVEFSRVVYRTDFVAFPCDSICHSALLAVFLHTGGKTQKLDQIQIQFVWLSTVYVWYFVLLRGTYDVWLSLLLHVISV